MDTVTRLLQANIGVHTELRGGEDVTAAIGEDVLRWIDTNVKTGMRTLEIGCGYSTALFASTGAEHLCISPFPDEHRRISEWCSAHEIDDSNVTYVPERSDVALPSRDLGALDVALVDGSHAFPHAFVDYWYVAVPLKIGGVLLVDDIQIWTGQVLRDFLDEQPGWELVADWHKTAAFRKTSELDELGAWTRQPYVKNRSVEIGLPGVAGYWELIKHRKVNWAASRAKQFVDQRRQR